MGLALRLLGFIRFISPSFEVEVFLFHGLSLTV